MTMINPTIGEHKGFGAPNWFEFENQSEESLTLFLEPYALDYNIPPNACLEIYMAEPIGILPKIISTPGMLILQSTIIVIYQDGIELYDSR